MLQLDDFRGATICESLADVVTELTDKHFILCAIVTDNAANEIHSVRELADRARLPIVRIPCLSHTLNLAVQDFFTALFGKNVFVDDLRELYSALPTRAQHDAFYGLDSICPTRWLCFGGFVEQIARKYGLACHMLAPESGAGRVLRKYQFAELSECFRIANCFMTATEGRGSFLDGAWSLALRALGGLKRLHDAGNRYAHGFIGAVRNRLTTTADLGQLALGFLVTERGLGWYRGLLPDGQLSGVFSRVSVRDLVTHFLDHFVRVFGANPHSFSLAFHVYLDGLEWPAGQAPAVFWDATWKLNEFAHTPEPASYRWLAEMAFILMRMPCSETDVERVFSRMKVMVGTRSRRIRRDLLEARLMIQVNGPALELEVERALDAVERQDEEVDNQPDTGAVLPLVGTRTELPVPVFL
jgi:hypothetical protein